MSQFRLNSSQISLASGEKKGKISSVRPLPPLTAYVEKNSHLAPSFRVQVSNWSSIEMLLANKGRPQSLTVGDTSLRSSPAISRAGIVRELTNSLGHIPTAIDCTSTQPHHLPKIESRRSSKNLEAQSGSIMSIMGGSYRRLSRLSIGSALEVSVRKPLSPPPELKVKARENWRILRVRVNN